MAKILSDRNSVNASPRAVLTARYNGGRSNLLLVVAFTLINVIMAALGGDSYFLFSAIIPYYIALNGAFAAGAMSEEYYAEFGLLKPESVDAGLLLGFIAIAVVILALYLLCWFLSKKRSGWLMAALVLFTLDTAFLFINYGFALDMLLDILFHGWVLYSLISAIFAYRKLQSLPEEEPVEVTEGDLTEADGSAASSQEGEAAASVPADSAPLRTADTSVKSRILLETTVLGHNVCYRRVKKTNELVIDGNVYDEYTAAIEKPHYLAATLGGHVIAAGCDGARSYICLDGEIVAKKLRWY